MSPDSFSPLFVIPVSGFSDFAKISERLEQQHSRNIRQLERPARLLAGIRKPVKAHALDGNRNIAFRHLVPAELQPNLDTQRRIGLEVLKELRAIQRAAAQ